jgi:predicted ATPase
MAHITEFTITGLAGRDGSYHQVLDRHINIFFGLNGSGKTSLLKILHSAMDLDGSILENVPFETAEVKIYSLNLHKILTLTTEKKVLSKNDWIRKKQIRDRERYIVQQNLFDLSSDSDDDPNPHTLVEWKEKPKNSIEKVDRWSHRYLPTSRLYLGARIYDSRVAALGTSSTEEALDSFFAQTLQLIWKDYNSQILQEVGEAQQDGLASILKAILSGKSKSGKQLKSVDLETAYDRVSKFLTRQGSKDILGSFDNFSKQYEGNAQLRDVVSDIDEVEKRIAQATAPRDELQNMIKKMFTGSKEIVFGDRKIDVKAHDKEIGLSSLSSGEKHIMRIFIETLMADQNSIIIDEPELSMHIDWQKDLLKTMRQLNPKAQIIIATHSPEVMADINDEQIFRL